MRTLETTEVRTFSLKTTRRSVCDWHYHFFCISVSRKFRFFESFFRKIGKTSGKCNVIRHFLENLWKSDKFSWKSAKIAMKSHFKMQNFTNFFGNACKICKKFDENLLKFCEWSGAKEYQSDRSRQELSNEYLVARCGFRARMPFFWEGPNAFACLLASIQPRTSKVCQWVARKCDRLS